MKKIISIIGVVSILTFAFSLQINTKVKYQAIKDIPVIQYAHGNTGG
ncbi:hypothetical protein [Bacillus sp. FSL R12-0069]